VVAALLLERREIVEVTRRSQQQRAPPVRGYGILQAGIPSVCGVEDRPGREKKVSDNISSGQQAAEEVARRWITTMQALADQMHRQQHTFQQMMQESMTSYMQLLNNPPFYVSQQPLQEGKRATGQAFHQASERWMELAQQQQQSLQQMSRQWTEQAAQQQQAFQQVVQQSLSAYMDLFKPPAR